MHTNQPHPIARPVPVVCILRAKNAAGWTVFKQGRHVLASRGGNPYPNARPCK